MFKRNKIFILFIIIVFLITGCGRKPEDTIKGFVTAMKHFDFEKMGDYVLVEEDNSDEDEDLNVEENFPEEIKEYFRENASEIEYEILETNVSEDSGIVKTKFKYVDGTSVMTSAFRDYLGEAFILAFSSEEISEERVNELFMSILREKIEAEETKRFVDRTIDIPVKKVEGEWYISDISNRLLDVFMSNYVTLFEDFESEDFEDGGDYHE